MHKRPIFADRREAGRLLAERLKARALESPLVLALSRGGVPVAAEIAAALEAPLDVVLVRKIGAPGHAEFALAALVEDAEPILVVNPDVPESYRDWIEAESARQAEEIARRRTLYRADAPPAAVADRTIVVVDDGIATGASLQAALTALRRAGAAKLVAAIPVAPRESLEELAAFADEIVCLATPDPFFAVGLHYEDFAQTSDEEVTRLLAEAKARAH